MIFHVGLVCVYLLSLANTFTAFEDSKYENCGFNLNATCETRMVLKADGKQLAVSDQWKSASTVYIPQNTHVIEIQCQDDWLHGGIIASGDNGLKTDETWSCSPNGYTWKPAFTMGSNTGGLYAISPDAEWIWTPMNTWKPHSGATCKVELDSSHCSHTTDSPVSGSGFNLYATCFEKMKVFIDDKEATAQGGDPNQWRETKRIRIPSDAKSIAIQCEDGFGAAGGIVASGSNLITDGSWDCKKDGETSWSSAQVIEPTDQRNPSGISTQAKWIWIDKEPCDFSGSPRSNIVTCKMNLDGSENQSPGSTVQVLPSSLNSDIISDDDEEDKCCQWRTFENIMYTYEGVISDPDTWKKYGCLNNCIFKTFGTDAVEHVCFASEGPECVSASNDFTTFSRHAEDNREKFLTILGEKTEQYGKVKMPTLKAKLDYIRNDIRYNALHESERDRPPAVLLSKYETAIEPPPLPRDIVHYIGNLTDLYNSCDSQEDLVNGLVPFQNDLKNKFTTYSDHNQISHFLIHNTNMISQIKKPVEAGGNDGINKFWEAVTANTEADTTRSGSIRVKRDGCDGSTLGNALSSTATGCVAGPEGCAAGAITGGVTAVASCIPDVVSSIASSCFASTSLVETMSGIKQMSELVIGDFIRTSSPTERFHTHFTEFLGWLDRQMSSRVEMLEVSTSQGNRTLTLTGSHIVFTRNDTKYAEKLQLGDSLMHWNGTHLLEQEVTEIKKTYAFGAMTPLTTDGTLLVDGYLASCYASFPHQVSDMAMIPLKVMPRFLLENEESQHMDGVRSVVKMMKKIGEWMGFRKIKKKAKKSQLTEPPSYFNSFKKLNYFLCDINSALSMYFN